MKYISEFGLTDEELNDAKRIGIKLYVVSFVFFILFVNSDYIPIVSIIIIFIILLLLLYIASGYMGYLPIIKHFIFLPNKKQPAIEDTVFIKGRRLKQLDLDELDISETVGEILQRGEKYDLS